MLLPCGKQLYNTGGKTMTRKTDIISMAKTIKDYFVKNKTYPKSVLVKGETFTIQEATYLMSSFVAHPQENIDKMKVAGASAPNGDRVNRRVVKSVYQDMAKRCSQYIKQNGKLPNYVTILDGQKCSIILWMLQLSKIVSAYDGAFMSGILINSQDLVKPTPKPVNEIFDYFIKVFGNVTSIDGALAKIQGLGYGFYYNNKLTNKQTIDGLKSSDGEKPNCTDVSQMMWHVGKGLNYEIRAIHVMCRSGVGHVRLQFKHPVNTGGNWINRDPACVIDGGEVSEIWCSNGTYLATNPEWFMEDLNK